MAPAEGSEAACMHERRPHQISIIATQWGRCTEPIRIDEIYSKTSNYNMNGINDSSSAGNRHTGHPCPAAWLALARYRPGHVDLPQINAFRTLHLFSLGIVLRQGPLLR